MIFNRKKLCVFCGNTMHNQFFHTIYDTIGICEQCYSRLETTKDKCFEGRKNVKTIIAPFLYNGRIRRVIKAFKFSGQKGYGELLGKMLAESISGFKQLREFDCIIPVPLHTKRLIERDYNQSDVLAHAVSEQFGVPVCNDYLFRIKDTMRQSSLKGLERKENVKNAFYADEKSVKGKRIILLDDIYTMGETVDACAKELAEKGAGELIAVALCKTPIIQINEYVDLR